MLKVGLTGNLGCGKSTVAKMFKELSLYVFDADEIIRGFYEEKGEVYRKLVEAFGDSILDSEGNIDRKKLSSVVFMDREKLRLLENITHRALYEKLEKDFKRLPEDAVVIVEATLLIEKGTYKDYDKLIVVYAPYEICKRRAILKGISEEDFERRWAHQMPIEEKLKYADFIIDNSGSIEETKEQVKRVYQELKLSAK